MSGLDSNKTKKTSPKIFFLLGLIVTVGYMTFLSWRATMPDLNRLNLPKGFKMDTFASNIRGARSMAVSPAGVVFVGTRELQGKVYALVDKDKDMKVDEVHIVGKDLFCPMGMAFKDGALYIGLVNGVVRLDDIENHLTDPPKPVTVNLSLPSNLHHGQKYIRFGPDGLLYIPVGAPCNVCEPDFKKYACMMRMNPDGTNLELVAQGIRNTVGFDWHPVTKDLWFTDNGRDLLGDNIPPDELNCAPKIGMNFGYPYRYGMNVLDPEFGKKQPDSAKFTPPVVPLDAHVAALGMRFYTGTMFPDEYKNQVFIAEHGSWNRSTPSGYRITCVKFPEGKPPVYEVFADGFLKNGLPWGRPADLTLMQDGSLLVSDDFGGNIYRISYRK